jgi:hypothetical protein
MRKIFPDALKGIWYYPEMLRFSGCFFTPRFRLTNPVGFVRCIEEEDCTQQTFEKIPDRQRLSFITLNGEVMRALLDFWPREESRKNE